METLVFRAIVRGTNKQGQRVRRVRNLPSPTYELAWASFEAIYNDMAAGLTDIYPTVLPPSGIRVDGTASVGFELTV